MRRSWSAFLVVLVVCAVVVRLVADREPVTSPFSVAGVSLGMDREEVLELLGEPDEMSKDDLYWYDFDWHQVQVRFDHRNSVIGVSGTRLELDSLDCTPESSHGKLPARLTDFLGEPDWDTGEGDLVVEYGYEKYHLLLQMGCTGWYFFLGER